MTKGLEIRAQIDTENVKGLLLINGGGAITLLAFLPTIFGKPNLGALTTAVFWALSAFQLGLVAAVIHNRLRRICSLEYERNEYQPPRCKLFPSWLKSHEPCVCALSMFFMWFSLVAFVSGGLLVTYSGLKVADRTDSKEETACWLLQEFQERFYKVNQCTGRFERVELDSTAPKKSLKP